jgi:GNAT superfamily N-acetyltransferase
MNLPDGYSDVPPGKIAAVVTSLQMLAPAPPRPESPHVEWTFGRVTHPDLNWYRDLFRRIGEDWLWTSRLWMPDQTLAPILEDSRVEIYALWINQRAEGLLELDFSVEGSCELSFFGVTASLVGSGAGTWLMNRAIRLAWSKRVRRFWLHTCTLDHPRALSFYMRSGFVPFRRQIEVLSDPRLTGHLPRSAAPQVPIIEDHGTAPNPFFCNSGQ